MSLRYHMQFSNVTLAYIVYKKYRNMLHRWLDVNAYEKSGGMDRMFHRGVLKFLSNERVDGLWMK